MARYWEWDAPFTIHPEETALLIVDMQTGFTQPDGPLYTPQSGEQLPAVAGLKKFCNENGIPVFMSIFSQDVDFHNDHYWFRNKQRGLLTEDGECKFKPGSPECQIDPALAPIEGDTVFLKYTYSCLSHTELETWLKKKRIRTLIICGTVTNWCVDSTIREAYHRDYNVVAVADCISAYDHCGCTANDWNTALFDLWAEMFGRVMTSEQVKSEIEAASGK